MSEKAYRSRRKEQLEDSLELWELSWGAIPARDYEYESTIGGICSENDVTGSKEFIGDLAKARKKRVRSTLSYCKVLDHKLVKRVKRKSNQAYRNIIQNNNEIPHVTTDCTPIAVTTRPQAAFSR